MRNFIFHGSSKAAKEAQALPDFHLFRSSYFSNPEGTDLHCGPPAHLGPTVYEFPTRSRKVGHRLTEDPRPYNMMQLEYIK